MIDSLIQFDKNLFLFLNKNNSLFDDFFVFITNHKTMALLTVPTVFILTFIFQKQKFKLIILCVLLTFLITDLVHYHVFKEFFQRLRPCWDPQISELCRILVDKGGKFGFVSGHASSTSAIVSIIFFTIPNLKIWIKDILIIWVTLICYSRIYVGKHFPLDVIFGVLLGYLIAFFVYKVYLFFFKKYMIRESKTAIKTSNSGVA